LSTLLTFLVQQCNTFFILMHYNYSFKHLTWLCGKTSSLTFHFRLHTSYDCWLCAANPKYTGLCLWWDRDLIYFCKLFHWIVIINKLVSRPVPSTGKNAFVNLLTYKKYILICFTLDWKLKFFISYGKWFI
jgi:hypothetical protein